MTVRVKNLLALFCLGFLALAAGLLVNRFRAAPIPLMYQSPEQRLDAELMILIKAPSFRPAGVTTIGLDEFRPLVEGKRALVLDARPSVYYDAGHIPEALNLSRENFAADYHRLRPILDKAKDKFIVVYCSGGDCHDSRLVASALISLGFSNVKVFTGGWTAWTEAKLPQEHR
jgi:rhodanese-related sulfurtransferase